MGRPRISAAGKKIKISISIDPEIYEWVSERTGAGKEFSTITHAVERGLARLRAEEGEAPGRGSRTTTSRKG